MIIEAFKTQDLTQNIQNAKLVDFSGLSVSFPIAAVSYCCHPNILGVYYELQRNSLTRLLKVLRRTMTISSFIFIGIGIFGYLIFVSQMQEIDGPKNILMSF